MELTGLDLSTAWVIVTLGGTSFVAWFFSMLAGGGSPLVLIPLLTFLLGAPAVAPVITLGLLIGNGQRSLFFWREIDWRVTGWYLPGCLVGSVVGALIFTWVQADWLQVLVGVALLVMVLNFWLGKFIGQRLNWGDRPVSVQAWHFLPVALVNSIASALIGSTGPIMNPLYFAYGLEKEAMIATKASNKTFLHIFKLISYAALGILEPAHWGYGLLIGLAAVPANWLGKWVLARMTNEQFRQMVYAFVAVSGVLMIWQQRNWLMAW